MRRIVTGLACVFLGSFLLGVSPIFFGIFFGGGAYLIGTMTIQGEDRFMAWLFVLSSVAILGPAAQWLWRVCFS